MTMLVRVRIPEPAGYWELHLPRQGRSLLAVRGAAPERLVSRTEAARLIVAVAEIYGPVALRGPLRTLRPAALRSLKAVRAAIDDARK